MIYIYGKKGNLPHTLYGAEQNSMYSEFIHAKRERERERKRERVRATAPCTLLTCHTKALQLASPKDSEIYQIGVASYANMLLAIVRVAPCTCNFESDFHKDL